MRFLPVFATLVLSSPAFAGATPWQDVAPGARLRLISSDTRAADGTTLVGIELDMPDSYQTYWRVPGDSGIPTEFDLSGSSGLSDAAIQWPFPTPETSGDFLDYVYHGHTVLPVELKADAGADLLKASVLMGVCSEVCVPVKASFSLPVSFASPDAGQSLRLAQAASLAPLAWSGAAPFGPVTYDTRTHQLDLPLTADSPDAQSLIASTADPTVIFDAPQKSPDNRSLLLPLRGQDRGTDWAKSPIEITFLTENGAFDISERVTAVAR